MPPHSSPLLSNTNNTNNMPSSIERRRKISILPLQISSPLMAQTMDSKTPIKRNQEEGKKPPMAMGGLRRFFSCKYHQTAVEVEGEKKKKKKKKKKRVASKCSKFLIKSPSKEINATTLSSSPSSLSNVSASLTPSSASSSSVSSSSSSTVGGSFRGMHMKRLSGCYECHINMDDPLTGGVSRASSIRRTNFFNCSQCGEIFSKYDSLQLHQAIKHAVSELGPEDNSRNIVEIIFKSSWLKKQPPMCKILRVLKIHHTQKTITRFENYRDCIKTRANKLQKKHPRCIADGNELLRFHSTTFSCPLGRSGSTSLCLSAPHCNVCSIIRDGFKVDEAGRVQTMETSGRAHDAISLEGKERAMLVCRVIAGRVSKNEEDSEDCDSVGGITITGLDELFVFDPDAILPCFVIIYNVF